MRVFAFAALAVLSGPVPVAWAACPASGPCVAILDTGIDPAHADFTSATIEFRNFTGDRTDPHDTFGHGTAVASRIAGTGACATGEVPNAHLLVGKVNFDYDPSAVSLGAVREGIEWAVAEGAQVINLSLGGPDLIGGDFGIAEEGPVLGKNDVEIAITEAARAGTVVVIAVGNTFVLSSEVNTPANALEALVVGAAARDGTPKSTPLFVNEEEAGFDTARDTTFSDLDPHVTAVGSFELVMARAAGTNMEGGAVPVDGDGAENPDGICVHAAGTSFATPWTAGLGARLRTAYGGSAEGAARVEYLVRLLEWSAVDTPYPYPMEGFGFVESPSVVSAAIAHAAAGTLPPPPEPNESLRTASDAVRAIY